MRKKYMSPLFAELEFEDVLYDSEQDNTVGGEDFENPGDIDWDTEDEFTF